jgi:GNAT superfamily N-acetyltransferase
MTAIHPVVEVKSAGRLQYKKVRRIIEAAWLFHYRGHVPVGWMILFAGRRYSHYFSSMAQRGRGEYRMARKVRFRAFIAYDDTSNPVAAMTIVQDVAYFEVDDLFVLPGLTSRGAGRVLLNHARSMARQFGKPLVLWAMRRNHRARRFYEREGARVCRFGLHSWYRDHCRNRLPTVCYRWDRPGINGARMSLIGP